MQHLRRIIALLTSTALLQLTALGAAIPCAPLMTEASAPAGHVQHAVVPHHNGEQQDVAQAPAEAPPTQDCAVRTCTVQPVILAVGSAAPPPPQPTQRVVRLTDDTPASPVQALEPPPPRA